MAPDPSESDAEHTRSCIGLSALAHALVLAAAAMAAPPLNLGPADPSARDTTILIQQYLVAAAQRESADDLTPTEEAMGASGPPTRCGLRAGSKMGLPVAKRNGRYGVQGPADNADPHIARTAGMAEASEFGMIGSLAHENAESLIAPWGRDSSLGTDPVSARGNMWGEEIAASAGQSGMGLGGGCGQECGGAGGLIRLNRARDPASGVLQSFASAASMRTQRSR
jgi:hypothetical protein